jgi:ubiquinone/menaquinone biosynthesis C-methylase UbiE
MIDLLSGEPLKIDLGCGLTKRGPDYVGVDLLPGEGVDVVGDALEVLRSLPDDRVAEIYTSHFLEHVEDLTGLMREVERVMLPGGLLIAHVPHFSNPYFFSDPTHRRTFGLYTFSYYAEDRTFRRRVPNYGHEVQLLLERVELVFRSASEFPRRARLRAVAGRLVNRSSWTQEFYEENLSWIFPCYEIRATLRKQREAGR